VSAAFRNAFTSLDLPPIFEYAMGVLAGKNLLEIYGNHNDQSEEDKAITL
jgi:hypothetical protein